MGFKIGHKGVRTAPPRICEAKPNGKKCTHRASKGKRLCEHCCALAEKRAAEAQARGHIPSTG
jgi:hypothetical protein